MGSDDRSLAVPNTSGSLWCRAHNGDEASVIENATFAADGIAVLCDTIDVDAGHRRQGLADALYRFAACTFEAPVVPSDTILGGGDAFWRGRMSIVC